MTAYRQSLAHTLLAIAVSVGAILLIIAHW